MNEKISQILSVLNEKMKPERFEHTIGVMYTAANLSYAYGYDADKAMMAAALHDCAKRAGLNDYIKECKSHNIAIREAAYKSPHLLHADLGEYLARTEFGIEDQEILHAIRVHTTGCPNMNLLEKILYVSDYIEPGRTPFDGIEEIRKAAYEDLDYAVYLETKNVIEYISERGFTMDPLTLETYNFYKKAEEK